MQLKKFNGAVSRQRDKFRHSCENLGQTGALTLSPRKDQQQLQLYTSLRGRALLCLVFLQGSAMMLPRLMVTS